MHIYLKTGLKKPAYGPNVRYLNGPPSHATLPFEYRTPILSQYSDESGIQVLGIHMVTVPDIQNKIGPSKNVCYSN